VCQRERLQADIRLVQSEDPEWREAEPGRDGVVRCE